MVLSVSEKASLCNKRVVWGFFSEGKLVQFCLEGSENVRFFLIPYCSLDSSLCPLTEADKIFFS